MKFMRLSNRLRIVILTSLAILVLPTLVQYNPTAHAIMASYNPAPANGFKAPLSSSALVAITGAVPNIQTAQSLRNGTDPSTLKTIQQSALRFIIDNSYFPQSETTIAIDPNNPDHIVGGFNDDKYFFCRILPGDCASTPPSSISGFTTSTDGGHTVAKTAHLPNLLVSNSLLVSAGDPSIIPSIDGNFFYASLAVNPIGTFFGNGIMIAKSNSNLFNPNVSCTTNIINQFSNPCWTATFVNGTANFPAFTLEDKERIAVDLNPSSSFYGSVYIGWDHFDRLGSSTSYLARCDNSLSSCTMLSPSGGQTLSGNDPFVAWTTPVVDKSGNVHVAWCNFGTFTTYGPVSCRTTTSPPGGNNFGAVSNIVSYMGQGTTLPTDTVVIGWATEQFRTAIGIISFATDPSPNSNNLYFTTNVCTQGHYYAISPRIAPVADDNPGDCGESAVIFSTSRDNGTSWTGPATLSNPAVNDQPYVTVDTQTGTVYVVYYTAQYDQFNHRTDVVASISNNAGRTFSQHRVTDVSNEPDSDPNMFNYIVPGGFGGSFSVPQYGDYFEATARDGTLWVLFTGNYAVEAGTFQTDPYLAIVN